MATAYYNTGKKEFFDGNIDLVNDTIKCAKMAVAYTPNIDTDQYYSDISASVVGTDQTLGTKTNAVDTVNDRTEFDAADTAETSQTITFDTVVFYKDTGTPATSVLIAYAEITEGTLAPTDGAIDLVFSAEGILAF